MRVSPSLRILVLPGLLLLTWLLLARQNPLVDSPVPRKEPIRELLVESPGRAETPSPMPTVSKESPVENSNSEERAPNVRLDNLHLGMSKSEVTASLRATAERPQHLSYSTEGTLSSISEGSTLALNSGSRLKVGDSREKLYSLLGEPEKHLPGLMGCGTDPLEYLYYRVDGGVLLVKVVKPAYPNEEDSEVPEEWWNTVVGLSLFFPVE